VCQTIFCPHGYPAREQSHYISFSGAQTSKSTQARCRGPIIFERLNTRCQPPRGSQANMPKIATKLRFLSQDRGIYAPLVHGTSSRSYSTMSHPAPTPAPEPVSPGVRKDDTVSIDAPVVSSTTYVEPIVTRKELWSYYRESSGCSSSRFPGLQHFVFPSILQRRQRACSSSCSLLGIMLIFRCVWVVSRVLVPTVGLIHIPQDRESKRYRRTKGYSMTLFQSLATSAGYDPVRGPGSSCLDSNASGKCVLPWGSGTKAVSAIVLIANGSSFAVRRLLYFTCCARYLLSLLGYDDALYNRRLCGGLRDPWQVAAFGSDPDMLGRPVCNHELDV
jgi:hypothetical protein